MATFLSPHTLFRYSSTNVIGLKRETFFFYHYLYIFEIFTPFQMILESPDLKHA